MNFLKVNSLSEIIEEIKWISVYIKKYRKIIVLYLCLGLVSMVLNMGGSVLSKHLIDTVTGKDHSSILIVAVLFVSFGLVSALFSALSSRISTKYSTRVTNEMQYEIYQTSLDVQWRYIKQFHTGDLINRISGDVGTVSNSVLTWIPNFIIKFFQAICCIAIIFYFDPIMALISVISTPVVVLLSKSLMLKMRVFSKKSREASSRIMSFIQESYSNVQSIKAFGIIEDFNLKFRMIQEDFYSVIMQQNKFSVLTGLFMSVMGMIVSYSCYGWGIYRLWSGFITFGTMTMFMQLASYLSSAFSSLVSMVPSAINTLTATRRLIDIVELPKEEKDDSIDLEKIKKEAEESGVGISIKDGRFVYDDSEEVFSCLTFDAKPGEVVAVMGPSGSGKTTIFRILLGISDISDGNSTIEYADGKSCNISASTRGLFAYVPQGNTILAGTIAENLRMVKPDATEDEMQEALRLACADEFVNKLPDGVNSNTGELGHGFSEGQAQRIAVARALMQDAPVLILDEATSALDEDTEKRMLDNIVADGRVKTCIIITHRPATAAICGRHYALRGTGISEDN